LDVLSAPLRVAITTMLERHLDGISSHFRYLINSGVPKGCNNKIEVLKLVEYGCRDDADLLLKSRAAFRGITGIPLCIVLPGNGRFGWIVLRTGLRSLRQRLEYVQNFFCPPYEQRAD
jgi:hypothetical protein